MHHKSVICVAEIVHMLKPGLRIRCLICFRARLDFGDDYVKSGSLNATTKETTV